MPSPPGLPLLATGHLFCAGAAVGSDEAERFMGTLGQVPVDVFPGEIDYLALGHLHRPQLVAGLETRRYAGAPCLMSFSEIGQARSVVVGETTMLGADGGCEVRIRQIQVPLFQPLLRLEADSVAAAVAISTTATAALAAGQRLWVELVYPESCRSEADRQAWRETVVTPAMDILVERSAAPLAGSTSGFAASLAGLPAMLESLDELQPRRVFARRLDEVPALEPAARAELQACFDEIFEQLQQAEHPEPPSATPVAGAGDVQ